MTRITLIFAVLLSFARPTFAQEVLLAVASNFVSTAEALADAFEDESGHDVVVAHGSTGALYAQIVSGAPYDVFLSADADRPERLRAQGLAREVTTYALGRLVLVSRRSVDLDTVAEDFAGTRVALADPMVAPYGAAAIAAMENLGLDTATFQPVLVGNVGQVATLLVTGNAEFAFLAEAQLPFLGDVVVTPLDGRYPAIRQNAALLTRSAERTEVQAFWNYLSSDAARAIIALGGYDLTP